MRIARNSTNKRDTYHSTAEKGVSNRWTIFFRSIVVSCGRQTAWLRDCELGVSKECNETASLGLQTKTRLQSPKGVVKTDIEYGSRCI